MLDGYQLMNVTEAIGIFVIFGSAIGIAVLLRVTTPLPMWACTIFGLVAITGAIWLLSFWANRGDPSE